MIRIYIYKIAFFIITFFSFLLWYSCFTTLYSFLPYIEVNRLYRYIHPLFFGFPSHLGLHRALGRAPCAIQQVLNQFSPVAQSCPTLCNAMGCSVPGYPVHHHLLELAQTHVSCMGDTIPPSHLCCPLLLQPSIFPSIRVFSNE